MSRPLSRTRSHRARHGFFCIESLRVIGSRKAFWISRLSASTTLRSESVKPLSKLLAHAKGNMLDLAVQVGREGLNCRLVAIRIDPQRAAANRRHIKTEAKRRLEIHAVLYTVVENCRCLGIDPRAYLTDVLTRLPALAKLADAVTLTPANFHEPHVGDSPSALAEQLMTLKQSVGRYTMLVNGKRGPKRRMKILEALYHRRHILATYDSYE